VAGLTAAELTRIRGRLEAFAEDVFASLLRADQRARGECYLRGLLLDGRRKSVEPMAQRLGEVHYQALPPLRRRVPLGLAAGSPAAGRGAVRGAWADGVGGGRHRLPQRRHALSGGAAPVLGRAGQEGQLPAGVSVNAVTQQASCPLDWRLFVPERWDEPAMATRRTACHLPQGVHHRPKWQLVLDMLDELAGWDLSPPVLLADSAYGEVGCFRGGLDARQVPYVVEVHADTSAYPEQVHPVAAPYLGKGRRPRPRYHDQPSSLKQLAMAAGQQAGVELV
jgi:SRSO17 transposase